MEDYKQKYEQLLKEYNTLKIGFENLDENFCDLYKKYAAIVEKISELTKLI